MPRRKHHSQPYSDPPGRHGDVDSRIVDLKIGAVHVRDRQAPVPTPEALAGGHTAVAWGIRIALFKQVGGWGRPGFIDLGLNRELTIASVAEVHAVQPFCLGHTEVSEARLHE